MKHEFLKCLFFITIFPTFDTSEAKSPILISEISNFNSTFNLTGEYWSTPPLSVNLILLPSIQFLLAGILSFVAAVISSAGGIGGGGLFIPILTIVAAQDLKTASAYSAFMVTGGSIVNVGCHMLPKRHRSKTLIDYEIALLSEPFMLLGVSCGVICNKVFPEWLITIFFVIFLAFCTFKTCRSGVLYWKLESEGLRRKNGCQKLENGDGLGESTKEPLLSGGVDEGKLGIPWKKIGLLLVFWFSFFVLYLLRGNRYGQGIIKIKPCGTAYWIISSTQIPAAIFFTILILYIKKSPKNNDSTQEENESSTRCNSSDKLTFPTMALLAGLLGGVFGIGGGMLISPLLLQMGIEPQVTAATCSFMVLFSSTMSAIQYLLLGMDHVYDALSYALICFVGSLVGLTLVQKAIIKYGRASLIVFSVGTVMALSTVLMTSFGAMDVWRDYTSGKSMGFKTPC